MTFKKNAVFLAALLSSSLLLADSPFHANIASGYAWSMNADIRDVNTNYWALSDNGYDENLGSSPYIAIGFGYRIHSMLDSAFQYTLYDGFQYQKNQTDPFGNKRTRSFDLTHQSAMFNFTFFPHVFSCSKIEILPFAGMGIGVGTSKMSNFQTVFYDPISEGVGLTTSMGKSQITNSFAWQGMGGFRIHPKESLLSLDLAYRYYNGGGFNTPSSVTDYNGTGQGEIDSVPAWTGTLQTNQLYFAINFSI